MDLTFLSPSTREIAAGFAPNRRRYIPSWAIIVALLCASLNALGCKNTDDATDVRVLERQLTATTRNPGAPTQNAVSARAALADACRIRVLDHTESGVSDVRATGLRVVVELGADAPFRRREHTRPDGNHSLSLELEGVRCVLPPGPPRAPLIALEVQQDALGSVLTFVLPSRVEAQLTRLSEPVRFLLDVQARGARAPSKALLVVLDPGHGGHDRGTRAADGQEEAPLVLDVARRTARWVGRYARTARVVLTRETDITLSLDDRAALANSLGADAFVSIHMGAAEGEHERAGVASYVLDSKGDTGVRQLASRENGTSPSATSPLQLLVGGLVQHDQARRSAALAEAIQFRVVRNGRQHLPSFASRGVRHALLYVLVGAAMPAVLVETAVLTQAEEAAALHDDDFRDGLAQGLASGIVRYLTTR